MLTLRGESGSGDKIYDAIIEGPDTFIAGVGGRGREQCLANARLIAAAPALLAACQGMVEAFTAGTAEQHTCRMTAIDAIARAQKGGA